MCGLWASKDSPHGTFRLSPAFLLEASLVCTSRSTSCWHHTPALLCCVSRDLEASVRVELWGEGERRRMSWRPCELMKVIFPLHLITCCSTSLIKSIQYSNKSHLFANGHGAYLFKGIFYIVIGCNNTSHPSCWNACTSKAVQFSRDSKINLEISCSLNALKKKKKR